ncbi:MAG: MCE family protein [Mycobacteriaceae bacterium]|nr:MCE family protein [Mycobacteriaceae bacterium]
MTEEALRRRRRRVPRRTPAQLGALGLGFLLLALMSVMALDSLPILGAGQTYTAEFKEAAGLKAGNEVRIAGVKVGTVTDVGLDGPKVLVRFRTKDAWIGDQTTASIQIKTLLGQKFLALDPEGSKTLDPDTRIPLSRTVSPYDVIDAFSDAAKQIDDIDTKQLTESMEVLAKTFSGTPAHVRSAIDGVSRLSDTLGKRDQELKKLFSATRGVTQVLSDRNDQFQRLIASGGRLLTELNYRQTAIKQLLSGASVVADSLSTLVQQNEAQIGPALKNLKAAIDILNANQANISKTLKLAAPFYGLYANVLGNGRWFDAVITNLIPPGLPNSLDPGRPPIRTIGGTR